MRALAVLPALALLLAIFSQHTSFAEQVASADERRHVAAVIARRQSAVRDERLLRQRQLPGIVAAFQRRTDDARAHRLAWLCYEATIDTPFLPIDLAEIALVETGGHGLSSRAVSVDGARGVWQLMPSRARSHGFSPDDMRHDDRCARAAVRELATKLATARGNLRVAKQLYCGVGLEARIYAARLARVRAEILATIPFPG